MFLGVFEFPHFFLVGVLAYLVAYYAACGRYLFPAAVYGAGLGLLALNRVLPPGAVFGPLPVDVSWVTFYFPFAFAALVLYAATFAKGFWARLFSVFLMALAIALGHFFMTYAGHLWRALVPALGLAPVFPEPQDTPLYILLYEMWKIVHQRPLRRQNL
ncbi:hypothetical protein [Pyrobaculum aerophilum]|uniref:hypothetical protein n=1 Tax=Pyrobaculum aerophilum TaxID=13773 RepID=UPI0023F19C06|nr:hypothetical protein [Pyrobaculum aerophilum]MCX8136708.1 hypothetical protein [Pyrobaculum aerophilum]